jgi:hypothetical protein
LTQAKRTTRPDFVFQLQQDVGVNLIADERYNPLKSRANEAPIR